MRFSKPALALLHFWAITHIAITFLILYNL